MSKHTPGPWFVHGTAIRIGGKEELSSARIIGTTAIAHKDKDENSANARLMAAAPDLLEALRHVIDMRGAVGKHACPGYDCSICTQEWGVIDEAILKAEGE